MTEAIDRVLESPPAWPELDIEQALPGLSRRRLSALDVFATSLGAVKPAATSLVASVVVARYVGPGAWLSVVIALSMALLLRSVLGEFTSRMVTTGSLYTFVVRGIGRWAGLVTALALVVAYAFAGGYAVTGAGLAGGALLSGPQATPDVSGLPATTAVLVVGIGCGAVLVRRVTTFTMLTLVFEVLTVVIVAVLLVAVLHRGGDLGRALSLSGADPRRVFEGATIMLAMLVGFEVAASHGTEAARPFRTVPRAMVIALLFAGFLTLACTIAVGSDPSIAAVELRGSVRVQTLWIPGAGTVLVDLFRLSRVLSLIACALAFWSAIARLGFVLANEGALPRRLARTDATSSAPRLAVVCAGPLILVPGLTLVARGGDVQAVLSSLLDGAGLIMIFAYFMVCLAVPAFLVRVGEIGARPLVLSGLGAVLMVLAAASNLTRQGERETTTLVLAVGGVLVPLATAWYVVLRTRRPDALARMGVHDRTIEADTIYRTSRPRDASAPGGVP